MPESLPDFMVVDSWKSVKTLVLEDSLEYLLLKYWFVFLELLSYIVFM
jgi:hypothetical protein